MVNHLRPIALTVDEPSPGLFHWALLESSGERALFNRRVAAAEEPYDSFDKAARAGLLNWVRLAGDDVRHGPRTVEVRTHLVPAPGPWTVTATSTAAKGGPAQRRPATSSS
jgi:hypothetical protein